MKSFSLGEADTELVSGSHILDDYIKTKNEITKKHLYLPNAFCIGLGNDLPDFPNLESRFKFADFYL